MATKPLKQPKARTATPAKMSKTARAKPLPAQEHKQRFDQLLDDAVLGVPPPNTTAVD